MKHLVPFAFALFILTSAFQNCSSPQSSFEQQSSTPMAAKTPDTANLGSSNNGHPYDGKIYVAKGSCSDSSSVSSRIIMTSETTAALVKLKCQLVDPAITLTNADFQFDAGTNTLTYQTEVFKEEKAVGSVPAASTWYIQLQGSPKNVSATFYEVDLFDTTTTEIQNLKSAGHRVICGISVGSVENWRPDASSFNSSDVGKRLAGATDERWLNTESSSVRSLMTARLDLAATKGCDGVDLDNVDGYSNNTGFTLTTATQDSYNRFMALAARDRKLLVGLRNAPELAEQLERFFDFAIADECFSDNSCDSFAAFTAKGKAIFASEYSAFSSAWCSQAKSASISLAFFNSALNGNRYEPCP